MVDFVEICNVCARKAIIEAAKMIINSDKVCHTYSDLNFGVTFLEHSVFELTLVCKIRIDIRCQKRHNVPGGVLH